LVWLVPVAAQLLPAADRYWAVWVFPLARLPEFVAGMLLARIVREGRWPAVPLWSVVTLTVAVYLFWRWLPGDFRLVVGTAMALAALVVAIAASWVLFRCVEQPGMRLIGGSRRDAAVRRRAVETGDERAGES